MSYNLNLDYSYDIECYPNFFSIVFERVATGEEWEFEISDWVDDRQKLYQYLMVLRHVKVRMVGFNNLSYDYPMLHYFILNQGWVNNEMLYLKSKELIKGDSYENMIWPNERFIPQIDLLKIHHFDNKSKMTGLKTIEFNMGSRNINDLPYPTQYPVTYDQGRHLLIYNHHDVKETTKFYRYTIPKIEFREDLGKSLDKDLINHNDKKIGSDYIEKKLNDKGIKTRGRGCLIQTPRANINLSEVILPYISFTTPAFNRVKDFFSSKVITETKGVFKDLSCTVGGLHYSFGLGGLHASISNSIIKACNRIKILDIDVKSYYPNIGVKNGLFPEHLTSVFCEIVLEMYIERLGHPKGSPENEMLKLALNGIFGDSNSEYSFLFDPKYTMSITINGQLLLCMLAESLLTIPGLKIIQGNTDGLTISYPEEHESTIFDLKAAWEGMTQLELEAVEYSMMAIRDVNNYIAVSIDGKVKRIGAYAHERVKDNPGTRELAWHKNHGMVVVAKAAEAALVYGQDITDFILNHGVADDFTLCVKIPRSSKLEMRTPIKWGRDILGRRTKKIQNITRYIITNNGGNMVKVMPPMKTMVDKWGAGDHYQHCVTGDYKVVERGVKPPSGKYKRVLNVNRSVVPWRNFNVESGYLTKDVSDMGDFNFNDINYEYYIEMTRRIVYPLLQNS